MNGSPIDTILSKLQAGGPTRRSGKGWICKCPSHDDKQASLHISENAKGDVLLKCHAGCDAKDVILALGLEWRDLFADEPLPQKNKDKPKMVEERSYDYRDEQGELLYQCVRFRGKQFRQRRPDGNGGWIFNLNGVRRILYRLPELLAAIAAGKTIVVVEGEKDADALHSIGITATTSPMGAGKWEKQYSEFLAGAKVVIVADKDKPGREHAQQVLGYSRDCAESIRIIEMPGEGVKDVSDWLNAGGDKKEFVSLCKNAPELKKQRENIISEPQSKNESANSALPSIFFTAPMTDYGNAERMCALSDDGSGHIVRWCESRNQWLVWNGKAWQWDESGTVEALAKRTIRMLGSSARENGDWLLEKFALKSESLSRIKAMSQLMRSEKGVPVSMQDIDRDDMLLNCRNGTLDLKTGVLKPHTKTDLITKMVEASFVAESKCPKWIAFLDYIMGGDQSRVDLLQRAIGASATGLPWQYIIFLCGHGANGKSMFMKVISKILSSYAGEAAQGLMLQKQNEAHPTEVADLMGKRFVTSEEMSQSSTLDEGRVKRLTSGNAIKARFMREDLFEFRPTHKLWFAVNDKPRIRGQDEGIWRRIKIIPFGVTIPEDQRRDFTEVSEEMLLERDGILGWIVEGCLKWQKDGLGASQAVDSAHDEYRSSMDDFGQFLDDCVVLAPDETASVCKVQSSVLYGAYTKWCEENGVRKYMTQTAFSIRMTDRGFQKEKIYQVWWLGITLKSKREDVFDE